MHKVYSKALDKSLSINRIVGELRGSSDGPCLVFFAGIHGNEPAGVFALQQAFDELEKKTQFLRGSFFGVAGNLWALERGLRYEKEDLNRLWTNEKLEAIKNKKSSEQNEDEKQQAEIKKWLDELIANERGPFYFFDLHTTSSDTVPFLTVNDSLLNRSFTKQYPAPQILGIEEFLDGPLLSYINELGYVSFGFESGQHDALASIENHLAFVLLSLVFAGSIPQSALDFKKHYRALGGEPNHFYEIYFRYPIGQKEQFRMEPGFLNFQTVFQDQLLAYSNEVPIYASSSCQIFMPLYQEKGEDGYFFIRRIPLLFMKLSALARRWNLHRVLTHLPGVTPSETEKDAWQLNLKLARFLTKPILHLLGFRSKTLESSRLKIKNREHNAKKIDYQNEHWYSN